MSRAAPTLTLRVKALVGLGAIFVLLSTTVTFVADRIMTTKANEVQAQLFAERLDSITTALQRKQDLLIRTGMEGAYRRSFEEAVVVELSAKYYPAGITPRSYPILLDEHGAVVMHPTLAPGDKSLAKLDFIQRILSSKSGELEYTYGGEASWCMHTTFEPWGWRLVYSIPLQEKYRAVHELERAFLVTLWGAGLFALISFAGLITLITRPIQRLTQAALRIAAGDLSQTVDTSSRDEIGALAKSFTEMRDAIRSKIKSLDDEIAERKTAQDALFELTRTLEERVNTRTAALTAAKESLEAEVRQRMAAEETMREAKKQAEAASVAKSEFLANMSHEIRTPMNGVLGMTSLLLRTPLTSDQRDYAEAVARCGDSLLTILNDILDFSKVEAGKLRFESIAFDLPTLVFDVVELYRNRIAGSDLDLLVDLDHGVPARLIGDPSRIRQLLSNLVSNAVKFTPAGHVLVTTRLEKASPDAVTFQIAVADTGIGISADAQPRLFQPFSQGDSSTSRKFGGTGLGLVLCKRIAEAMEGSISLQSSPGEGSTFTVTLTLPIHPEPVEGPPVPSVLLGARVLIVDDNPLNRRILEKQLALPGVVTELAASGGEALDVIHKYQRDARPFDAVILDYHMPGLSGEAVGEALRADPKASKLAILMLTSSGQPEELSRMAKLGFDSYLVKPVRAEILAHALGLIIARKREGRRGDMVTRHTITELSSIATPAYSLAAPVKILLAEDNAVNQLVARGMLEEMGASVTIVEDGLAALAALDRSTFDIILMDCQMPRMDGLTAAGRIRADEAKRGGHIPIIALTASAMDGDREECLAAGMDDYLPKPMNAQALFKALTRLAPKAVTADTGAKPPSAASTPAPARAEITAIDEERFRSTEDLFKSKKGGFYGGVIDPFLEDVGRKLAEVRAALAKNDAAAVRAHTHSIKGAARVLGFEGLAGSAETLERMAKKSSFTDAQRQWAALEGEFTSVKRFIDERRRASE